MIHAYSLIVFIVIDAISRNAQIREFRQSIQQFLEEL